MEHLNPATLGPFRHLVTAEETGGRLAVVTLEEIPGSELPLHIHHNEDEFVYVLSGDLTIMVGHERHDATAGSSFFLRRGSEHGYAVSSSGAKLLIALIPAGLEPFLETIRSEGEIREIEWLIARAAHYGLEITGELDPGTGS